MLALHHHLVINEWTYVIYVTNTVLIGTSYTLRRRGRLRSTNPHPINASKLSYVHYVQARGDCDLQLKDSSIEKPQYLSKGIDVVYVVPRIYLGH